MKKWNPTEGWMRSELERRGVMNRGHDYSEEQLAAMLREVGVEVVVPKKPRKGHTVAR